jgi:hypothetical protein
MADTPEKEQSNGNAAGTTVTGNQLLVAVIFLPVVIVWLFLAARIIWSATSNPETLESIEGLLTALAVLTIPVSMGLNEMFKAFSNESAKKDE